MKYTFWNQHKILRRMVYKKLTEKQLQIFVKLGFWALQNPEVLVFIFDIFRKKVYWGLPAVKAQLLRGRAKNLRKKGKWFHP